MIVDHDLSAIEESDRVGARLALEVDPDDEDVVAPVDLVGRNERGVVHREDGVAGQ
jgi:hypothetical protein